MKRVVLGWILIVAMALLLVPLVAGAQALGQAPALPYKPLSNQEMSQAGTWPAWIQAFRGLTGKQQAEVVTRHTKLCLESFTMTEAQRSLIKDLTAKFMTEEAFSVTDPTKRAALEAEKLPAVEHARTVLGDELWMTLFMKKPPISVLEAVRDDPKFR